MAKFRLPGYKVSVTTTQFYLCQTKQSLTTVNKQHGHVNTTVITKAGRELYVSRDSQNAYLCHKNANASKRGGN